MDYRQQVVEQLKVARRRVRKGNIAKGLKDQASDLFEVQDEEISLLVNEAFGSKPLSYERYLSVHGEVKGLRRTREMLDMSERDHAAASEQVKILTKQLKDLDAQG